MNKINVLMRGLRPLCLEGSMLFQILLLATSFSIKSMNFDDCPNDVKLVISGHLVKNLEINQAIKDIKALSITNRSNNQLLNTEQSIDTVASLLSQKFYVNKPYVVKLLKMPGSCLWHENFSKSIPSNINEQFLKAIASDHTSCAFNALNQGANVDANIEKNPALIYATLQKNINLTRFLLNNGANVNIQNVLGETAFINASSLDDIKMMRLLLEYGANQNLKTKDGKTALDYAMLTYP